MSGSNGAGQGSEDSGGKREAAPPASESHGADGNASGGEDVVPKTQFIAAIRSASAKTEAVEAENQALREQLERALNPPRKPPTREELDSLIASGDLTRGQADKILEDQLLDRATSAAAERLAVHTQEQQLVARVESQIAGYAKLKPDAWVEGSPDRNRVAREFQALIELGYPATKATEVAALRAAFGDLQALQASSTSRPGPADTHSETGGGDPPGDKAGGADGPPKGISAEQKRHYERLIDQGMYPGGWKQVAEELKFSTVRRKQGARA